MSGSRTKIPLESTLLNSRDKYIEILYNSGVLNYLDDTKYTDIWKHSIPSIKQCPRIRNINHKSGIDFIKNCVNATDITWQDIVNQFDKENKALKNNLLEQLGHEPEPELKPESNTSSQTQIQTQTQTQRKGICDYFQSHLSEETKGYKSTTLQNLINTFLKHKALSTAIHDDDIFGPLLNGFESVYDLIYANNERNFKLIPLILLVCEYRQFSELEDFQWLEIPKRNLEKIDQKSRQIFNDILNEFTLHELLNCSEDDLSKLFNSLGLRDVNELKGLFVGEQYTLFSVGNLFNLGLQNIYHESKEKINSSSEFKKRVFKFFKSRKSNVIDYVGMQEKLSKSLIESANVLNPQNLYNSLNSQDNLDPIEVFLKDPEFEFSVDQIKEYCKIFKNDEIKVSDLKSFSISDLNDMGINRGPAARIIEKAKSKN